ncbi:hypothetical protein ACFXTH_022200 [Malus domestica]
MTRASIRSSTTRTRYPFLRRHSIWFGSILSLLAGAAKKFADELEFFRSTRASAKDTVADFFGVVIGSLLIYFVKYVTRPKKETVGSKSPKGEFKISPSFSTSQFNDANSRAFPSLSVDFLGKPMTLSDHKGLENCKVRKPSNFSVHAQASVCVSRAMRWWEKTLHPDMVEIHSSQKLVDSLKNVGD